MWLDHRWPSRKGVRRVVGALLACGLLAACGGGGVESAEFTGTRLDPPFEVSSTPLVDTAGETYSLTADTDKDLTLVFFGYTHCPDICGQVMATLAGTLARLDEEQKERLDVVFVTTDPARDDQGEKLPSGGYEVTHGTQVIAIDADDEAPAYWKVDVTQAELAHDVTALLDEG